MFLSCSLGLLGGLLLQHHLQSRSFHDMPDAMHPGLALAGTSLIYELGNLALAPKEAEALHRILLSFIVLGGSWVGGAFAEAYHPDTSKVLLPLFSTAAGVSAVVMGALTSKTPPHAAFFLPQEEAV